MKDLTAKYASQFSSETWKLRVEETWWQDTLLDHSAPATDKTNLENAQLQGTVGSHFTQVEKNQL